MGVEQVVCARLVGAAAGEKSSKFGGVEGLLQGQVVGSSGIRMRKRRLWF